MAQSLLFTESLSAPRRIIAQLPVYQPPIIFVGSGLAGMTAAFRLAESGRKVRVLEGWFCRGKKDRVMVRQGMLVESGLHKFLGLYRALPKLLRDVGVDPHVLISWVDEFEIHVPETRFSGKLLTDRFDPSPLDAAINRRSCCCLPAASPGGSRWITWISCDSFRNSPGVLQSAFDGAKSAFILH